MRALVVVTYRPVWRQEVEYTGNRLKPEVDASKSATYEHRKRVYCCVWIRMSELNYLLLQLKLVEFKMCH